MRRQTLEGWLDDLASGAPTPGGGGAAALSIAMAAALVSMVCNITIGKPRYAEHEPALKEALGEATHCRSQALDLAEADARVFGTVMAAYKLPKATDDDKAARNRAIQDALVGAAEVPLQAAGLAAEVIGLAERILDRSSVNVLSDVAVAAAAAQAGLTSAAINVEINLAALEDESQRTRLAGQLAARLEAVASAETVVAEVRSRIAR